MQVKKSIFSQFYSVVEGNFTKNILKETKKMIKLGTEVPRVKRMLKNFIQSLKKPFLLTI